MSTLFQILLIVLILFGGIYSLLIFLFTIGWFRLKIPTIKNIEASVSVIIPVRNEEKNILGLLNDLKNQNYPPGKFEVLVIDDHSEDGTEKLVQKFISENPAHQIRRIQNEGSGKKSAIQLGVQQAKNPIIFTIDADCRVGAEWMKALQNAFSDEEVRMISAPVVYQGENTLFKKIQSFEFLSLVASAAGAIGIRLPFMCNGANLAFRKSVFEEVGGFEGNAKVASGDDVFLLHKIKKQFGASAIRFSRDKKAIVKTQATENFSAFLKQRKRWASKSKAYKDFFTLLLAAIVAGFNTLIILFLVFSFIDPVYFALFLLSLALKFVVDLPILWSACRFSGKQKLMWLYLPVQLFYPFYTAGITLLALLTKNEWKGRRIS